MKSQKKKKKNFFLILFNKLNTKNDFKQNLILNKITIYKLYKLMIIIIY